MNERAAINAPSTRPIMITVLMAVAVVLGIVILYRLIRGAFSGSPGTERWLGSVLGRYDPDPYNGSRPAPNVSSQPTALVSTSAWQPGSVPGSSQLAQIRRELFDGLHQAINTADRSMLMQHRGGWQTILAIANMPGMVNLTGPVRQNLIRGINLANDVEHVKTAGQLASAAINKAMGLGVTDITVDGLPAVFQLPSYSLDQEATISSAANRLGLGEFSVGLSGVRASVGDLSRGVEPVIPS